jgi:Bacterial cell division membrane protein
LINKIANPEDLWMKQLAFYGISFILMFIVYKIGNERIYRLIWLAYGILVIFLIGLVIERFTLIFLGRGIIPYVRTVNGATRWYSFPGFDFQPSEFMKIVLILCASDVIYNHNNAYPVHRFNSDCIMLAKVLLVTIPPCILIFLQNDAGFTSLILVSVIFILFASGLQMRWFVVGGIILSIGLLILSYLFIFNHDVFVRLIGSTY